MENISGKWALVTGSSRGIGQQIALGLAKKGVNIVLHGRTFESTLKTQALLKDLKVEVKSISGILDTEEQTQKLIDQAKAAVKKIDILYCNAAIQNKWKEVWDITIQEWKELFQVDFFSAVSLTKAFAPEMIKNKWGRIVLLSSGIPEIPQLSPYGCSKWAINKFARDISAQFKDTGVTINSMDPGWLRTDLGGPDGQHPVEAVLPGALVPVITDVLPNGGYFCAQDYRGL